MLPPFQKNRSLNAYSTFGIGGFSRYFTEATSSEEMSALLVYCHKKKIPFFILGKGSNTLFDERGFNGLVILNKIDFIEERENLFRVGAGTSLVKLSKLTTKRGYGELAFGAGIPATVGGALFMNAGAGGQEIKDSVEKVSFVNEKGELLYFSKEELTWSYRTSIFQKKRGAIVEATFCLAPREGAAREQKKMVAYRLATQPYGEKSCGCIFRNPKEGSAGELIERCGLKGASIKGAMVSDKHANFIVNRGGATATDVLALINKVQEEVYKKSGIKLQEEVCYIPYES